MGNCDPSKTNVNLGFASVDIDFLGVKISHVILTCSQFSRRQAISPVAKFHHLLGRGFIIQRVILIFIKCLSANQNHSDWIKINIILSCKIVDFDWLRDIWKKSIAPAEWRNLALARDGTWKRVILLDDRWFKYRLRRKDARSGWQFPMLPSRAVNNYYAVLFWKLIN